MTVDLFQNTECYMRRMLNFILKNNITTSLAVLKYAYFVGLLLIVLAIVQMVLTMYYPVSPLNPLSVYFRNITTFLAVGTAGLFMIQWCNFVAEEDKELRPLKSFRFITILACIVFMVKCAYSLYVVDLQFFKGFYVILCYASDAVAWFAFTVFAILYYYWVLSSKNRHANRGRYKKLVIAIAILCFVRCLSAVLYTLMKYNPYNAIWIYYLASAVAWLLVSQFFLLYVSSPLVRLPEAGHYTYVDDPELEKALDRAAKS